MEGRTVFGAHLGTVLNARRWKGRRAAPSPRVKRAELPTIQRPTTLVAPLHAARTAQRAVPTKDSAKMCPVFARRIEG
ncbi:MAG TPA: hypothetical protein VH280_17490 [Verrucomicrobiae bacterium]|nr:hypothetical protein [Verrucomicrobiae bacterium]